MARRGSSRYALSGAYYGASGESHLGLLDLRPLREASEPSLQPFVRLLPQHRCIDHLRHLTHLDRVVRTHLWRALDEDFEAEYSGRVQAEYRTEYSPSTVAEYRPSPGARAAPCPTADVGNTR